MELHGCTEEPEPEDFVCDSCRIKELESANIQLRERLQEMSDELDKLKTPRPPVSEVPNKVTRNMSTPEARAFWESAERSAEEVASWPDWKRAGINVSSKRSEPRTSEADALVELLNAAENYVKAYDGPGTARNPEAKLKAAAIAYANVPRPNEARLCPEYERGFNDGVASEVASRPETAVHPAERHLIADLYQAVKVL